MTSPASIDVDAFERVLKTTVSVGFMDQLCRKRHLKVRAGIYSLAVVVWLMIYQRLNGKRTLSSAVQFLAREALHWSRCHSRSRGLAEGQISSRTGGYCRARLKMPKLVATDVCDHILEQLQVLMRERLPDVGRPVFVIDGTTLSLQHRPELVRSFPPGSNQYGDNHWPTMLLVAFHDAHTGLALRPSWGPMYGKHAVGEQQLAAEALERLPADAVVLADSDFGIFAFAHAVQQTQRSMIFRLTKSRVQKVLSGIALRPGRRRKVRWEASRCDRMSHPDLPERASVEGWVVACPNPSRTGEMLFFFTTLDVKPKRILALYGLRWNMETDLRSLKRTVNLHQVTSKSQAMVEKEVLMAICAYNVVRAVQYLSASQAGLRPRQLSFSAAQDAVMAAWPYLQRVSNSAEFHQEIESLLLVVAQSRLPERSHKRSYPRKIWGRGGHFPFRRSPGKEEPR
jgi:putative transposase